MNTYHKELFEVLRERLDCDYVSDLRVEPYHHEAILLMKELDLAQFSLSDLEDMAEYVYNIAPRFEDYAQAETFFHG